MYRFKSQKGMSLVEATIILLVLMLLTSVLAPSIFDYVNDAKDVKVKEDCEAIGTAIARLTRDVGQCLKKNPSLVVANATNCTKANRVDLLYSDGSDPAFNTSASNTFSVPGNSSTGSWVLSSNDNEDTLENHLVKNTPISAPVNTGYSVPTQASFLNPLPTFGRGWRGAYVSSPVGPDPWGHRYSVNSMFLSPASDATDAAGEGGSGWTYDTVCISAGRNETLETEYRVEGSGGFRGTSRGGDDFIYVIAGSSR